MVKSYFDEFVEYAFERYLPNSIAVCTTFSWIYSPLLRLNPCSMLLIRQSVLISIPSRTYDLFDLLITDFDFCPSLIVSIPQPATNQIVFDHT